MYIRDLQGNEYFLQGTIKHDQELNGDERIDMDIHYTDINAEFLQKKEDLNMWIIIFENKEYRIISTKQTGYGDKYTVSVTGILYVLDWLNTHRIYRRIDASLTDVEAFRLVFNDTPFTFNIVDNSYSNRFEGLGEGQTRLEMFKTFLDRYDYEMNIVGNVVYLKNKVGNDANFEYRYKVNANNISKDSDAGELWTYAQGYGNYSDDEEGKDVVDKAQLKREYTSPLEKIIGERREAPPIRDGRITQQNTMDNALKKLVDESMQISFSADIQDMREQGYNYQVATIGDRVFLVDERIGLDTEIRVVKISRTVAYTGQLLDIQITFGTTTNADNYSSNLTTAVKDITDIMKGRKSIPFTALDTVSKSMVSKIQNTSSELLFDDMGIHAIDKKNANNIVTMNSSGWMLSTDGGRTAKTAMTAEGIVADAITTGTMHANRIQGGSLASNSGSMVWNLDKNQFNFYSGSTAHYWGSSDIQFHHFDNTINMEKNGVTAFLSFMTAIDDNYPAIVIGASEYGTTGGTSTFVGLKAQSAKATPLGYSQAEVIGDRVIFDSHGGSATTGSWVLETYRKDGDKVRSLYGRDLDLGYKYELGTISNRYENLWAKSLVGSMRLVSDSNSGSGSIFSMDLRNGFTFSNSGLSFYYDGKGYSFGWVVQELQSLNRRITEVQKNVDASNARIDAVNERIDKLAGG
mgnify:CR=1 FL=1